MDSIISSSSSLHHHHGTVAATVSTGDVAKKEVKRKRQRGIIWTPEEHKLFLDGLEKYGKGDWKSISRHFVLTRTPTQVASHAQKHFLRNPGQKSSTITTAPSPLQDMPEPYINIDAAATVAALGAPSSVQDMPQPYTSSVVATTTATSPLEYMSDSLTSTNDQFLYTGPIFPDPSSLQVMNETYTGIVSAAAAPSPVQNMSNPYTSNHHQTFSTTTVAAPAAPSFHQDMSEPSSSITVATTTATSPLEYMSDSLTSTDDQFLYTSYLDFPVFPNSFLPQFSDSSDDFHYFPNPEFPEFPFSDSSDDFRYFPDPKFPFLDSSNVFH